jgi:hypothetical protein
MSTQERAQGGAPWAANNAISDGDAQAHYSPTTGDEATKAVIIDALNRGQSVIPMKWDKRPLVEWKEYQTRQTTAQEVMSWNRSLNGAIGGWARVTGEMAGIIVLDDDTGEWMKKLGLRPHVRTGSGGYHWIGRHPGWRVKTLNSKTGKEHGLLYPGLDIRGDGGYSLIAGYNHKGGYTWLRDAEPDSTDLLPRGLLEFFGLDKPPIERPKVAKSRGKAKQTGSKQRSRHEEAVSEIEFTDDQEEVLTELLLRALGKVQQGKGRNNAGFDLACQLRDHEYNEQEALAIGLRYAGRVPPTNTKGDVEEYGMSDYAASVKSAFSQPTRDPFVTGKKEIQRWERMMENLTNGKVEELESDLAGYEEEEFESGEPMAGNYCDCCGAWTDSKDLGILLDMAREEMLWLCQLCLSGECTCQEDAEQQDEGEEPGPILQETHPDPTWAKPLAPEAFHGLAGEFVRRTLPHTEADPAAMLIQFLAAFGNAAGRGPYVSAGGSKHHLRLFPAIVGTTNEGAKGTSWAEVHSFMERVDLTWSGTIGGGMNSGEGLIHAVRDPSGNDPGVIDKRKLCLEAEFASVLKMPQREGNILSELIRKSWDDGNLQKMTRQNPCKATGAHIAIIGHITPDELRRTLSEVEKSNGFANRFLFACSYRSKLVPRSGSRPDCSNLVRRMASALTKAKRDVREIQFSEEAGRVWDALYKDLRSDLPGMLGSVTARRAPQVLRLAATYAAIDGSTLLEVPHLLAAIAVWDYCAASAAWIFGTSLGDEIADAILNALRRAANKGLTKTDITKLFNRNVAAPVIDTALDRLRADGFAVCKELKGQSGRPTIVWLATRAAFGLSALLPLARRVAFGG